MNSKVALLAAGVVIAVVLVAGQQRGGPAQPAAPVQSPVAVPAIVGPAAVPVAAPVQPDPATPTVAAGESVVPNYVPRRLKVFEGHWQGMDGRLMTEELARKLNYPRGIQGVLLGEVTLNAAFSGLLGGDIVVKVDEFPVATMEDFQAATREIMNRTEARIGVLRKDSRPGAPVLRKLTVVLRSESSLGFAQLEGAPMILAGDPRPHGYRGACTECHPIGQGFELTPDPDLISLPPPPITRDIAAKGTSSHEVRGPCEACHVIR